MAKYEQIWTIEEINLIKQHFVTKGAKGISLLFPNRTVRGIWDKARKLGLRWNRKWTDQEIRRVTCQSTDHRDQRCSGSDF